MSLVNSDSPDLPARFAVSHVCVRITEPVALGGERSNVVSEKVFESRFITKVEPPHGGVEAVGADDEIEGLSLTSAKRHVHAARAIFEAGHAVPEPHVNSVLDRFVERRSQRRTRKAHAPALDELLHRALVEAADPPARAIDDPEFLDLEVMPAEFVQHAHLLGHVVAEAPKVDDVAAGARFGRLFHQGHRISVPIEPPSETRACHPSS